MTHRSYPFDFYHRASVILLQMDVLTPLMASSDTTQQEEGKYVLEMHPELSTARPAIKGN